jgi:hypothetical protein
MDLPARADALVLLLVAAVLLGAPLLLTRLPLIPVPRLR